MGSTKLERVKGIEPSSQAWEARILPLNHTRFRCALSSSISRQGRSRRQARRQLSSRGCGHGRNIISKIQTPKKPAISNTFGGKNHAINLSQPSPIQSAWSDAVTTGQFLHPFQGAESHAFRPGVSMSRPPAKVWQPFGLAQRHAIKSANVINCPGGFVCD